MSRNVCKIHGNGKKRISVSRTQWFVKNGNKARIWYKGRDNGMQRGPMGNWWLYKTGAASDCPQDIIYISNRWTLVKLVSHLLYLIIYVQTQHIKKINASSWSNAKLYMYTKESDNSQMSMNLMWYQLCTFKYIYMYFTQNFQFYILPPPKLEFYWIKVLYIQNPGMY